MVGLKLIHISKKEPIVLGVNFAELYFKTVSF